jgi:HAE1 family hydrophobic/amphiphilic exporter-1
MEARKSERMTLPEIAIKRHVTMLMIIISLIVLGGVALLRLPLAFLPDFEEPQLFVRIPYPNASPEQIERMIVRPVEDALGSLKGLQQMWSQCDQEGGMIRLQFDWDIDMQVAWKHGNGSTASAGICPTISVT